MCGVSAPLDTLRDRARGCLLGGALGDALGGPVEFMSREAILRTFPGGVDLDPPGHVTDDTQMTLFSADGLIRGRLAGTPGDALGRSEQMWRAYRRWLLTQEVIEPAPGGDWLLSHVPLWAVRAPGNTCLSALRGDRPGLVEQPVNESKGCGGVMRAAPAGFLPDVGEAYRVGCDLSALTHGHPSGWISGGALALLTHLTAVRDVPLWDAVSEATAAAAAEPSGAEVARALTATTDAARHRPGEPDVLVTLGEGWVAEEALAIAVYAALSHPADVVAALRLAVEHGGDSDSTGAIAGNILGAASGVAALPRDWLARVELAELIATVADDLAAAGAGEFAGLAERYPPT
ncbi:MAG: ADP-ribosylglycohydrolase family protein [Micromonosporaceae bacterium]|nr:ADP-ribosylglycohydrolase family protein [Micromonosporaceae bacterium]